MDSSGESELVMKPTKASSRYIMYRRVGFRFMVGNPIMVYVIV